MNLKLALAILFCGGLSAHAEQRAIILPINKSVWRIFSSGKAERLPLKFNDVYRGGPTPTPSPDMKLIAFTRGANIWTYDVQTAVCRQVTAFPDWPTDGGAFQALGIQGWNSDRSLVVSVLWPEWEVLPVPISLDQCSKAFERKPVDTEFQLNEAITFTVSVESPTIKTAPESWSYFGKRPIGVMHNGINSHWQEKMAENEYQFYIPLSGKQAVAMQGDEVVSISTTGVVSSPLPKGSAGGSQWPSISPNESKIAYTRSGTLVVDGKEQLPGFTVILYWWIDDESIAATGYDEKKEAYVLKVVRVSDGKVLGEYFEPK